MAVYGMTVGSMYDTLVTTSLCILKTRVISKASYVMMRNLVNDRKKSVARTCIRDLLGSHDRMNIS